MNPYKKLKESSMDAFVYPAALKRTFYGDRCFHVLMYSIKRCSCTRYTSRAQKLIATNFVTYKLQVATVITTDRPTTPCCSRSAHNIVSASMSIDN